MDPSLFSDFILIRPCQTKPSRKQHRPDRVFQVSSIPTSTTLIEAEPDQRIYNYSNKKIKITISQPAFKLFTKMFPKPFQTVK